MKELFERIREARKQLNLTQEYVADYLGLSRATITQMENGNRNITAEELSRLSSLFGLSADTLLNGNDISEPATMFARSFDKLNERDKAEIMNMIRFKEQHSK